MEGSKRGVRKGFMEGVALEIRVEGWDGFCQEELGSGGWYINPQTEQEPGRQLSVFSEKSRLQRLGCM